MERKILCRVLTGQTASGKTALSVRLAKEMGWEIISMDSMQIYRRMNIGTAKPDKSEMNGVRHHMIDICEPDENYSVADYREAAERIVRELRTNENKEVLFVGGTGLYLHAMIHALPMGNVPADAELRRKLNKKATEEGGKECLHALLQELDPETAGRLPVNDIRRVIRAIEVTKLTGIPFSQQPVQEQTSEFDWRIAATSVPRDILYRRINDRVDGMIRAGLFDEVRQLLDEGVPVSAQSMSGLGYKEMIPCVRGLCSSEEAAYRIALGSRHYAKRQETFLKRESGIVYFDALAEDAYSKLKDILA